MKTIKILFLSISTLLLNLQNSGDQIIGKWQNPDKSRQIEIVKIENLYFGKILWLKNPKEAKIKKGETVIKDLKFQNNKWCGKLKISTRKEILDIEISMNKTSQIEITLKYGLINKTKIWDRIK